MATVWAAIAPSALALTRLEALSRLHERRHRAHRLAVAIYVSLVIHLAGGVMAMRLVMSPPSGQLGLGGALPVFLTSLEDAASLQPVRLPARQPRPAHAHRAATRQVVSRPTPGPTTADAAVSLAALDANDDLLEPPTVVPFVGPEPATTGPQLVAAATLVDDAKPSGVLSLSDTLAVASPEATARGAPWGLGFGRLALEVDGPRARTTSRDHATITGRIIGGEAVRMVLLADGRETEVPLRGRTFEVPVTLRPGLSVMHLVAFDATGWTTDEAVAFDYTPLSAAITIATPDDSHVIVAPRGSPVVEGVVRDDGISTVSIVAGSVEVAAPVEDGRFHRPLTLDGPVTRVWAEVRTEGAPVVRSAPVTIVSGTQPVVVVAMEWPDGTAGIDAELRATWRARADRVDGSTQALPFRAVRRSTADPPEFWYLESPRPGVYTFELHYRGQLTGAAVPSVLYVSAAGDVKARRVAAASAAGSAGVLLAKLLLPQGLLWDDGDWAAGESLGSDSVTRFRFSDGVVWTEPADRR
jgi:hypothetical protein